MGSMLYPEVSKLIGDNNVMDAQLLNYLHISGLRPGFLVNFQPLNVSWKRLVV